MRTDELAYNYISRAEPALEETKSTSEIELYSIVIRGAQEVCLP